MQINKVRFKRVVEEAKAKAAGNKRWLAATDKAADAILNDKWIITELQNCLMITSASEKTYRVTEMICQCESFFFSKPCAHRAAARLINLYNAAETADKAVSRPTPRITRSVESDRTGVRYAVVRCENWVV